MEFDKNVRVESYEEKYFSCTSILGGLCGDGEHKQVDLR